MNCMQCGHGLEWHGDRAITACIIGVPYDRLYTWLDMQDKNKAEYRRKITDCTCTGWVRNGTTNAEASSAQVN